MADILDLDAEVVAEHTADLIRWLPVDRPRQVVDLGCGTGAGTFALLAEFPEAHVTAVDTDVDHLRRLRDKACELGLADRVTTVQADLDTTWPDLGTPDLVWASASMHHMADPARALRQVHDVLAPGGLFAVVELAGFPRFLGTDLEDRIHAASDRRHADLVPHRGADWGPKLTAAGFTVEAERTLAIHLPQSEVVGRYALAGLRRMRGTVDDVLSAEDLAAFDDLLDPHSPTGLLHRTDLAVRTERSVWAARKA
ncbi:class I SAM-dependent methyltransferase [Lentzea sp. NPDC042327]|uniref:class I SAM-dependent methyltransferase n=1 Tax=Lentzea sp. NPDC042327 TaxID=3154801 RepID=UPI0033EF0CAF